MEKLYELKDSLMEGLKQFDTVKEGRLKMGELEALNLLTDTVKNVDKICMLEDGEGYSEAMEGDMYGRGSSYANRGQHYVRGHYSRADGRRGTDGRYSRASGKDRMVDELEMLMEDATTEKEREAIRRCISQIEKA